MKRGVSFLLLLFLAFEALGQYGNEWIQYPQQYFKIPVAREGIYRISRSSLQQAGFPLSADPRTFQLFHRGVEQAITVPGEGDGVFDTADYIEFYGRANDGTLDSTLYEDPAHQPHRYYNLYSDTTFYFLTAGSQTGKRMPVHAGVSTGLDPESYHLAEKMLVLGSSYSGGVDYGNVQKTAFDAGEGWMGVQILQSQEVTYSLEGISHAAAASGKPKLEVLLTGRGSMNHIVELYAGARLAATVNFEGYQSHKHVQEIEWPDIDGTGKLQVKIRVTGSGGPDRVSTGYIRLLYPQQITMEGVSERSFFPLHAPGPAFIKIGSPPAGLRLFDVTEPADVSYIQGELTETLGAVIPPASTARRILASTDVLYPATIKPVSFRQINPALHNYIIITHPVLRKPAAGYLDPVKAYAEYRALPEGGGFDTLIVNINQLYDQFNYGESSPRAIFQFLKFFASVRLPDYLFLIGKGLTANYGYWRNPSAFTLYKDLVPTAGLPASDMAYSAGLSGLPNVPAVATGRLTANNAAEVVAYLNKVRERDALPFNDLGRKKILHLSGGIEEYEPAIFRQIMQGFESVAEDLYLGGDVQAIAKQSTDLKLINIAEKVNEGLGLITFFGHSAPNTLDFDIGLVTDPIMGYENAGKYPFLLMNGCDVGSFFLNANIFGENWIKTPDKGAIGFIAHSSYGLVSGLQRYSTTFYNVAFGDSVFINKGVGQVQKEVAKRYTENYGSSPQAISQLQQMVLLGDPAVKIFGAGKPDYAIDKNGIHVSSFNGEPITALTDSFRIHIPVQNYGVARDEYFRIEMSRQFIDGTVVQYDSVFRATLFSDTLTLIVRNADNTGFGMNTFTIHVDADNLIDELSEANNIASYEYFIPLNSIRNLYPYNYSIVQTRHPDLSFQYTDLQADFRECLLEIDTASTFDSEFKQQFQVSAEVLGRQRVALLDTDSTVYYWRTKISQPLDNESKDWAISSFTYLSNGPEGWAQLQFPQYENNARVGLVHDPELNRMEFRETVSNLAIKTFSAASGKPVDSVSFRINGVEFNLLNEGGACRNNTINLVAFDKGSTQPYAGIYFKWYEPGRRLLCGREPYVINSFTAQELITGNQDDLTEYVDNVHVGDSVVLFNIGDAGYNQWPEGARIKLGELGISIAQLDGLQDGEPVIIFARKGSAPGTARIFHAPSPQTDLRVNSTIIGRATSGAMSSVIIGPARRWDQFIVQVSEVEPVDDLGFLILGVRSDNGVDTLRSGVVASEELSGINAETYPYLKLVMQTADEINLTAAQLEKWMVLYEPVAEGMIYFRGPAAQQTVAEGQIFSADFGFVNVSNKNFFDSLAVSFDLLNPLSPPGNASSVRISPPLPGDTTLFTVHFNTVSKAGLNDVKVHVNPGIEKEYSYDNNWIILPKYLNVLADRSAPVLEVTFDGRYLENNEYVSADPVIAIRVWDENPFMVKKDTLDMRIFLALCASDVCGFERVYFSRNDVTWEPATPASDFIVYFSPENLADGRYLLRIEASDASGNLSGEVPYEIGFRVENEPSAVAIPPYPNPFVQETIFEIMVTGNQSAAFNYNLQLSNLGGKLVTELSGNAGLHIGKNRITWNGSGKDGERLPNGIYFYRLLVSGGVSREAYYGKVVLLR